MGTPDLPVPRSAARHVRRLGLVATLAFVVASVAVPSSAMLRAAARPEAARETVLYSFPIGAGPSTGLTFGPHDALYGMGGGGEGYGVVYRATPRGAGKPWSVVAINDFTDADGAAPAASISVGADGTLYGTTVMGGYGCINFYCGVAFALTKPSQHQYFWNETVLHDFGATFKDGSNPYATLVADTRGAWYGTTSDGGDRFHPAGTVFRIAPRPHGNGWTEEVIHAFAVGGSDGTNPFAGVVIDAHGTLYGTTVDGTANDCGVVYAVVPPQPGSRTWTESLLYVFAPPGSGDACSPRVPLTLGRDGTLYGTSGEGGSAGDGAVYALTPPASGSGNWTERVLHSFSGPDGVLPGPLALGPNGVLYGTCYQGGSANVGLVFALQPPKRGGTQWSEVILHTFAGTDGANPANGVIRRADGVLFGTTTLGGTNNAGTLFAVTP